VTEGYAYESCQFTPGFLKDLLGGRFSASEQERILRAIVLLDTNERHPSLRVHQLKRDLKGQWSASATDEIRITFRRLDEGRKQLISVSRHYGD
jgi:mRNA-degrading endonuclease YafQ of YafQ-DinJ toxin-antitoxin module